MRPCSAGPSGTADYRHAAVAGLQVVQSSKYKDLLLAQKRTNDAFIKELLKAKAIADKKKAKRKAKVTTKKATKK